MRRPFLDFLGGDRVYPITDRLLSGLSHAEQVRVLAERGFRLIQLREKHLAVKEFHCEAEQAMQVARATGVRLIINDRVDIALAVKADGAHLGQDDLSIEAARRLLGEDAIIGFSTHNLDQARSASDLPVDYLALGPIFVTSTKQNADPVVGLSGLAAAKRSVSEIPLVGIGGVNSHNRESVLAAGADAVAVISDLWATNPSKT